MNMRVLGTAGVCGVLLVAAPAAALTSATISPRLAPDRLGARAALTVSTRYGDDADGLPEPVRRAELRLPAGLTLDIPRLRSCSQEALEVRGPSACPAASRLGAGQAVAEYLLGRQLVDERVALSAFLGPLGSEGEPTFLVLASGTSPFVEQVVLGGVGDVDRPPYGERLTMTVPEISTVPSGPDATIASLSLTIGGSAAGHGARSHGNAVLVPRRCPAGGFPFAARFTYADGSSSEAHAKVRCPARRERHAHASARAARTLQLSESAHLRLTSRKGFALNEQGAVAGTVRGTIYVHLRIVSSSRVSAEVSIYRPGGSITGYASASYRRGASRGTFAGTMTLARGTGAYAHIKGGGLSFSGTIQRSNYAIAVHVGGRVTL